MSHGMLHQLGRAPRNHGLDPATPVAPTIPRPTQVSWNVNSNVNCNLNCMHCFADEASYVRRPAKVEQTLPVVDRLAELGVERVAFSGGEPLLYGGLTRLLDRARERGIRTGVLTNGTLLDDRWIGRLRACGVEWIQVSIDGPPAVHDVFRGKEGAFALSVDALRRAVDAGFRVSMATTLTTMNLDHLEFLYELSRELGAHWGVEHFTTTGVGARHADLEPTAEQSRAALQRLIGWARETDIKITDPLRVLDDPAFRAWCGLFTSLGMPTGCSIGVLGFSIAPNGDMLSCPRLPIVLGNVFRDDLAEVWRTHPLLNAVRLRTTLRGKCGRCDLVSRCGGCRASAYAVTGDALAEDPKCWKPAHPAAVPAPAMAMA